MPNSQIDLAATTFKNVIKVKEHVVSELTNKRHDIDPRECFPNGNFEACERAVEELLKQNHPNAAKLIAAETNKYREHIRECIQFYRTFVRMKASRKRSPEEIRRSKLSKLVKDIGAGRVRSIDEYLCRRDEIFGS